MIRGLRRDKAIKHVRFLAENCRGLIAEVILEAHFDPELARPEFAQSRSREA
jgi:hypothetical protein